MRRTSTSDTVGRYEIVRAVKAASGVRGPVVEDILEHVLSFISSSLASGQRVELRRFGILKPVVRPAKQMHNPLVPGARMDVPARVVVRFTAGTDLRRQLNS